MYINYNKTYTVANNCAINKGLTEFLVILMDEGVCNSGKMITLLIEMHNWQTQFFLEAYYFNLVYRHMQ